MLHIAKSSTLWVVDSEFEAWDFKAVIWSWNNCMMWKEHEKKILWGFIISEVDCLLVCEHFCNCNFCNVGICWASVVHQSKDCGQVLKDIRKTSERHMDESEQTTTGSQWFCPWLFVRPFVCLSVCLSLSNHIGLQTARLLLFCSFSSRGSHIPICCATQYGH